MVHISNVTTTEENCYYKFKSEVNIKLESQLLMVIKMKLTAPI